MKIYQDIKKRIEMVVNLPAFTDELFPQDIASMLKSRLTFKEAISSPDQSLTEPTPAQSCATEVLFQAGQPGCMNNGIEAFRSQLQKELGLSIGPKDPLLALWVSQKELLEQNAAQHQKLLSEFQAALGRNQTAWSEQAKALAQQSLNAGLQAAQYLDTGTALSAYSSKRMYLLLCYSRMKKVPLRPTTGPRVHARRSHASRKLERIARR